MNKVKKAVCLTMKLSMKIRKKFLAVWRVKLQNRLPVAAEWTQNLTGSTLEPEKSARVFKPLPQTSFLPLTFWAYPSGSST